MPAEPISILLFSDTHIGFDYPLSNKPSRSRRRGYDFFDNFKLVIDQAIELQVDYLIHCGDVFEKQNVPAFLMDETYSMFLKVANAGIKLFIVPGNHERSVLPPSLFLNHPNIHLFDVARTYSFPKLSLSGFPYFKGNIRSLFPTLRNGLENNLNTDNFNILCVHHAIDGVKAGYNFFEFRNRKDTLNIKDLPGKFDLILSGHIHKHQIMQAHSDSNIEVPIIYSGSTERTMFDEMNEIKGYHIFQIAGKNFKHQFHPIRTRPMYRIDLKSESIASNQTSNFLSKQLATFEADALVQIVSDDEETLCQLSKLKTKGFFADTMNITISGFSSLHWRKQD